MLLILHMAHKPMDWRSAEMNCQFCNTEHNVAVPLVHLNGTSGDELLQQLATAVDAMHDAIKAVVQASPNGRDYYLQPGAAQRVQDEHCARLRKLDEVRAELGDMLSHVQEQINFREEQRRKR